MGSHTSLPGVSQNDEVINPCADNGEEGYTATVGNVAS